MINISGNIDEVYVSSTKIAEAYVGSQLVYSAGPPLPYDSKIEYLRNTASQCIVTDYVPTGANIKIQGKFTPISYSANYAPWFQAYTSENAEAYRIIRANNSNTAIYFTCGSKANVSGGHTISRNTTYVFELTKTSLTLNNVTQTLTPEDGTVNTGKFAIFGNANKSTFTRGRLYYLQVWDGSTLVFDFIPARVGTVGYLYDKVSGVLFGNSGTGSFTLGPDI